ncbi:MAG: NAD(P)-dependent oxidoreductase [Candidatus Saccharibacteria bacterium]|nr:NAD(P)-dependent oxidoreductase [Pseudorhodobacter sp.]
MSNSSLTPGIAASRLPPAAVAANFADLAPRFDPHEALVAADRCYFCHDAPCMTACPTTIDIPLFIRQIATGTPEAAAKTIFAQNIMGGMCARVCPTETLCEEVCVREVAEGKPVEIGRLQRYATDTLMAKGVHPFQRAPDSGKRVAVVGAGPAGLSAAHRLALHGHAVTVFERRAKAGGLNEYGIAAYKSANDYAAQEVAWLLKIGGIAIQKGELGADISLPGLEAAYDAVFLGIGLGGVNALGLPGEDLPHVRNAVDFIAELRQAADKSTLPIGRDVVVIGGGMTAVDAAVQSKLLGAQNVTMVYRRTKDRMSASLYEQEHATAAGVTILYGAAPKAITTDGVVFTYGPGDDFVLKADQVFKAIGQTLTGVPDGIVLDGPKIARTGPRGKVWAGGDCAAGGEDLTVTAVAEGRDAAEAIHAMLTGVTG